MADNDIFSDNADDEIFNSMLSAAQKHAGKSEEPEPEAPPLVASTSGKLTQEQIEALLGGDDDSSSGGTAVAYAKGGPKNNVEKDDTEEIASIIGADLKKEPEPPEIPDDIPDHGMKYRKKKKKPEKAETESDKEKKEKPALPKLKFNGLGGLLGIIILVGSVLIAAAGGFVVSMLMFSDIIKTDGENFAIRSANALNSTLPINTEFYVYRAYVKKGAAADECMLYAVTSYGGEDKNDMYRIVVEHEDESTTRITYTLDENNSSYIAMKESGDPEIKIQASLMKNYSDLIAAADKEISIGSPSWVKIDCTRINNNITSQQIKNASAIKSAETTAAEADK